MNGAYSEVHELLREQEAHYVVVEVNNYAIMTYPFEQLAEAERYMHHRVRVPTLRVTGRIHNENVNYDFLETVGWHTEDGLVLYQLYEQVIPF